MPLTEDQQLEFNQAQLINKRLLIEQLQRLGGDLTKALGAIDALLLILNTKEFLAEQDNEITDADLISFGITAAQLNEAVGAIAAISAAAKDPANNWTGKIGAIVRGV